MKKSSHAILLLLLLQLLPAASKASARPDSLAIKIGQMIMIGFRGLDLKSAPSIEEDLRKQGIGGVVLFDYDVQTATPVRNIQSAPQLRRLTSELQHCSRIPLFIAIDQEGGRVCRLKTSKGFPPTVSAAHLGAIDNADTTRTTATSTAALLSSLGINMNLAPCVDLNVNPSNPVIGRLDRSFSGNPAIVLRHSQIFVDAFHRHRVIPVLKHFPGHGSSTQDTHRDFTDVSASWTKKELDPYRELIRKGYHDPVMTAHVFNAQIDSLHPATLSKAAIGGILRRQLGFRGVVISDDMQMKAIADRYSLEEAIRLALEAGVDILLFGNNVSYDPLIAEKTAGIVRQLVETGVIPATRIDASFRRIMALKQRSISH